MRQGCKSRRGIRSFVLGLAVSVLTGAVTEASTGVPGLGIEAPHFLSDSLLSGQAALPTGSPGSPLAHLPGTSSPDLGGMNWQAAVQSDLEAREYHLSDNGRGLQAPNRAHGIRTWFDVDGIRVTEREGEDERQIEFHQRGFL